MKYALQLKDFQALILAVKLITFFAGKYLILAEMPGIVRRKIIEFYYIDF